MVQFFQTYIERPVFNLLELIYAVIPGHDLGLSIIIFTIIIRLALWPLVRKQLHQTKAMRKLQPELKKIKKAAAGDRQKEARLQMELYKEHGVKPFSTIGTLIVQIPIFIALYQSVLKLIKDPNVLLTYAYEPIKNLPYIQYLSTDITKFDHTFLGVIDLSMSGLSQGAIYFPAILLGVIAAVTQFYQSKMLLPDAKDSRKLSTILKEAGEGKQADQSEVSAAVSRGMIYFLPGVTFIFAISVPSALSLYLITTAGVGIIQQRRVLHEDEEDLHKMSEDTVIDIEEAKPTPKTKPKKKKPSNKKKRRR